MLGPLEGPPTRFGAIWGIGVAVFLMLRPLERFPPLRPCSAKQAAAPSFLAPVPESVGVPTSVVESGRARPLMSSAVWRSVIKPVKEIPRIGVGTTLVGAL
jgi:hypothetical protein